MPAIKEETGRLAGLKRAPNGDMLLFHEKGIHRWKPVEEQWIHYGRSFGLGRLQPELHAQTMGPNQLLCLGTARGVSCLKLDTR
ncbi:MAG: hypothetical protein U5L96_04315 [Owenweeksia sp.]|nr:hypothetical protein [Owenweeksia sp.]